MAEIVEDGNGAKPALTVLPFRFLTLLGCIVRGEFGTTRTRIGHLHLRAETPTRVGRQDRMQFADFVGR